MVYRLRLSSTIEIHVAGAIDYHRLSSNIIDMYLSICQSGSLGAGPGGVVADSVCGYKVGCRYTKVAAMIRWNGIPVRFVIRMNWMLFAMVDKRGAILLN